MAPVRAVGTVELGARWRPDNRPDFPGIAVWVDAVAQIEIDAAVFEELGGGEESGDGFGAHNGGDRRGGDRAAGKLVGHGVGGRLRGDRAGTESAGHGGGDRLRGDRAGTESAGDVSQDPDGHAVPSAVEAWSPDYAKVWRPLSGTGREPRPGLLLSVVRAGAVVACPAPLPDPPTGLLARALSRLERSEPPARELLPVEASPPQPPRAPQKSYGDVRALVGVLVEILMGRRAAAHAARFADPEVCGRLRKPHYPRTAALKSVRLAESGNGVEATALLLDRGRTRVVALRFDRAEDSGWRCSALQTG